MMGSPNTTVFVALGLLALLYIVYWFRIIDRSVPRRNECRRQRPPSTSWPEYFSETEGGAEPPTSLLPEQSLIDFSDILVTDENRAELQRAASDKEQIQTINDRFRAAKRNVVEHKMKNGVYTNKQRRQLVENLLRRPPCGRRVRSWRTENSDFLRGDVRPKNRAESTNILRSAKNNPEIDLHPGSLGPMAGMHGLWLSEENLPGNIFQDVEVLV